MKNRVSIDGRNMRPRLLSLAIAGAYAVSGAAYALPTGGQVVAGQARLERSGNTLTVSNTPGAIINWSNFSVGALESVRFEQQSALSAVLNRVVGSEASAIYGQLSSNGRVWLLNPNGILFGQGSRIDVPGFVASTLDVGDADFQAGRMNLRAGALAGNIRNEGRIGNAGSGNLYLIAPDVQNQGLIQAENGNVLLAAGRQVSLIDQAHPDIQVVVSAPGDQAVNLGQIATRHGSIGLIGSVVAQRGQISADRVEVDDHGRIVFRGAQRVEVASGSVTKANGPDGGRIVVDGGEQTSIEGDILAIGTSGKGGQIDVLGREIRVEGQARVDASGETGGGKVRIGGDYQGKNPEFRNAATTYFGPDAQINVDAQKVGAGGTAILWADERTEAHGRISARGGEQGGDGGFVETSARYLSVAAARVDTRSPMGRTGSWLLDPSDIYIGSGTPSVLNIPGNPITFYGGSSFNYLDKTTLEAALGSSNVLVDATSLGPGPGSNIYVNTGLTWASGNTLTLSAQTMVSFYGGIAISAPTGKLMIDNSYMGGQIDFSSSSIDVGYLGAYTQGAISQAGTGVIKANSAAFRTLGGSITLSGGNQIAGVAASSYGGLTINNARADGMSVTQLTDALGSVDGLSTNNGVITVSLSSGALSIQRPIAAGSSLTANLNAAGGITQSAAGTVSGGLTLGSSGAIVLNSANNAATNLQATLTGSGSLVFQQGTGALSLGNVTSASGNIEVTGATGQAVSLASSVSSTSGNITVNAASLGIFSVGAITTGGTANVNTGSYSCNPCGGISASNGVTLKTDAVTGLGPLSASSGIVQITSKTPTNNISIGGYGGLALPSDFASTNPITAGVKFIIGDSANTGALTLGAAPSFNLANIGGFMLNGGNVDLGSNALNVGSLPLYLWSNTGPVSQATTGGGITAGSLNLSAGTFVSLLSTGNQIGSLSSASVSGSGGNFQLQNSLASTFSVGPITTNAGLIYLNSVGNLQQTGDFSSGGGSISVTSSGSISMGSLGAPKNATSGGGAISYQATSAGQTVSLGYLDAGTGSVQVTASGSILDNNGAAVNATGGTADFTSQTGAASAATLAISADTNVGLLSASACGSGGSFCSIDLNNPAAVQLSSISSSGVGSDGLIKVTSAGNITVVGNVNSSQGPVHVETSAGNISLSNNVSISGYTGAQITATTGSVSIYGGAISANNAAANVNVQAGNNIEIYGQSGYGGSIFAGNDVFLTATAGKLILTSESAYGGSARITANAPFTANLSVPSLYVKGWVIDGVEDGVTTMSSLNANTGIFVNGAAGIVGSTFLITYASPPSYLVDTTLLGGNASHTYGSTPNAAFGYVIQGGAVSGDNITGTASFTPTISNLTSAGTFTVSYASGLVSGFGGTFSAGVGLSYTVNPALLSVALQGTVSKIYDASTLITLGPSNFLLTGFQNGDAATVNLTAGNFVSKAVGNSVSVGATLAAGHFSFTTGSASNYTLPVGTIFGNIGTITPATISAVTGIAALNKVVDGTSAATLDTSGAAFSGKFAGDTLTVATATGNFIDPNVGTGKLVNISGITLGGVDAGNYTLASTTATTTASILASAYSVNTMLLGGAASHTYGQTPTANFGYSLTGGALPGDSISGTPTFTPSISNLTAAGTFTVFYQSGLSSTLGNSFVAGTGLSYTVNKALLTAVLQGSVSKVYDASTVATLAPSNFLLTGLVNGDSLTVTQTAGNYQAKNAGTGIPVAATLSPGSFSGTGISNYVLPTNATGNIGEITKATISSVSGITALDKTFDGTTSATLVTAGAAFIGKLGGDVLSVASATGSFSDPAIGAGKVVSISGITLGGTDAGNYLLANSGATATASILSAASSYLVDTILVGGAQSHTYGEAPTAIFGYSLRGGVAFGDAILGNASFTPTINSLTPAGNFVVSYAGGLASTLGSSFAPGVGLSYTVNPKLLTAITANLTGTVTKVYDGNTVATLAPNNFLLTGFVTGDGAIVTKTTGHFASKNVGNGIVVSTNLSAGDFVALGSTDLSNYILPTNASGAIGTITTADLGINLAGVVALNKTYDGSIGASFNGGSLSGVIGNDQVGFTLLGHFADRHAAEGKAVSLTGAALIGPDAANYHLSPTSGSYTATISPNPLVIWNGGGGNVLWSNPANWGGILPDQSNVLAVLIPSGSSVTYDVVGQTRLQKLNSEGIFVMAGGLLDVATSMSFVDYRQTGGILSGGAALDVRGSFAKSGGLLTNSGPVTLVQQLGNLNFVHDSPLLLTSASAPDGNLSITNTGATNVVCRAANDCTGLYAKGDITVVAKSPLTIDAPVQSVAGSASFTASYPGILTIGDAASFKVAGTMRFAGTGKVVGTLPAGAEFSDNSSAEKSIETGLRQELNCLLDPAGCSSGPQAEINAVVARSDSTQQVVAEDLRERESSGSAQPISVSELQPSQGTNANAKPQYCKV